MKMNILFPEFVDFLNESNADYLNSGNVSFTSKNLFVL